MPNLSRSAVERALRTALHEAELEVAPDAIKRAVTTLLGDNAPAAEDYDAVADGRARGRAQNEAKADASLMWR